MCSGLAATTTLWLKADQRAGLYQLMSYAGGDSADVPVVDNVVSLTFAYFSGPDPPGGGLVPLPAAHLVDGPWRPSADAPDRWDADLDRVRAVAVTVRVQAAVAALRGPAGPLFVHAGTSHAARRLLPDLEIRLMVSPRNLTGGS